MGLTENVRFSTIYRTGHMSVEERKLFFSELEDYISSLICRNGYDIIWGDFNIHVENSLDPTTIEL